MGTEDSIALPASGDSGNENKNNGCLNDYEISVQSSALKCEDSNEIRDQSTVLKCEDNNATLEKVEFTDNVHSEYRHRTAETALNDEKQPCESDMEIEDLNNLPDFDNCRSERKNIEEQCDANNTTPIEYNKLNSGVPVENSQVTSHSGSPTRNHKSDGVKRPRLAISEQQPSVHVMYSSLTRASKQKLDELLKQWSQWHAQAQQGSLLSQDNKESENLESGEETFFPAICIGTKKTEAVSFWIDTQMSEEQQSFIALDDNTVPLYDRGFTLGLTSGNDLSNVEGGQKVIGDASRCFNCGSYNHALKDCPKPRDNVAVNNARKEYNKSKRHHNSGSRNPTRYYQNSLGGKYDDLRPGALDAETRQLLGLKEFDPPPWLNRMRELGYPVGYLDTVDEDQPSGITIFADEELKEQEDGEITEVEQPPEPRRKMSVGFPGINAPIPENANKRLWTAEPSSSDFSRSRSNRRSNHYAEHDGRANDHYQYQQWGRDSRDDRPPGVDTPYSSRYGGYGLNYDSPRGNLSMSRSPNLERFQSDRGRRSSLCDDDYSRYGSYNSSVFTPPNRR